MLKFQAYSGKMRLLVYSSSESDSVKWKTRFAQVSSLFRKNETSRLLKFRVRFSETKISFLPPKRFCFIQTEALLYSSRAFVPPQQSLCFTRTEPLFLHSSASVRPAPPQACRTIFILLYLFVRSVRLTSFPIARRPPPDGRSLRASAPLSGRNVRRALRSSTRRG